MIRRLIAVLLIVLGIGTIGAAIASATVWKPDTTVTVPLPNQPGVNYVITDPGVLNIVNETVKIRAFAEDAESPVFLGMGRTNEVEAWVAQSDHGKITGLETWEELLYTTVDGVVDPEAEEPGEEPSGESSEENSDSLANPANSDMWLTQVNGVGEVSYTWEEIPGRWSMIVATDGESPAPRVELTWERDVPTPALIPGIIVGSALLLIGVVLAVIGLRRRKPAVVAPSVDADGSADDLDAAGDPIATGDVGADDGVNAAEDQERDDLAPVEEIMAAVEATASDEEAQLDSTPALEPGSGELDADYPHVLAPQDAPVALTRREIREQERLREREAALTQGTAESQEQWPTQEAPIPASGRREAAQRKWWQRKPAEPPVPATGPIIIDEDTGEIIITGEIDLSTLTPQARADSWRATWGLDQSAPTRWVPVLKQPEEEERDD